MNAYSTDPNKSLSSTHNRRINSCFNRFYPDFRRLAYHICAREPSQNSLQPTALVHEIYLRLMRQNGSLPQQKGDIMGIAARQMKQALIDRARRRQRRVKAHLNMKDVVNEVFQSESLEQQSLKEAFQLLADKDPRLMMIAKLRIKEGQTLEEIGRELNLTTSKVKKDWQKIKLLLKAVVLLKGT